jgi:hypothetical protein
MFVIRCSATEESSSVCYELYERRDDAPSTVVSAAKFLKLGLDVQWDAQQKEGLCLSQRGTILVPAHTV